MSNYYIGNVVCTNELSHHGIIGQRWGVRRFQNPDGSLTPEGRIRYGSGKERENSRDSKTGLTSYERNLKHSKDPKKRDMYYAQIRKETDFRHIKDKKLKADAEKKILEMNDLSGEDFYKRSERDIDRYSELWKRINEESGNMNDGIPVTKAFEKKMEEIDKKYDEWRWFDEKHEDIYKLEREWLENKISYDKYKKKRKKLFEEKGYDKEYDKSFQEYDKSRDDMCEVVLKDIGYENTPEAKRLIKDMIFWD